MKETYISSPTDLDTALAGKAMSKHAKRWKIAEGRSFRWTEGFGAVVSSLMQVVS